MNMKSYLLCLLFSFYNGSQPGTKKKYLWKPGQEIENGTWIPGEWKQQWGDEVKIDIPTKDNQYLSPRYKQSWRRARRECQKTGGDLASIHNPIEHLRVKDKIGAHGLVWVGGEADKFGNKKIWTWSDGTLFGNFSAVNIAKKKGCMTLSETGIYKSTSCTKQLYFVCKKGCKAGRFSCKFPYYNPETGKIHHKCTTDQSRNGKPYCMVTNRRGCARYGKTYDCNSNCPVEGNHAEGIHWQHPFGKHISIGGYCPRYRRWKTPKKSHEF